MNFQTLHGKSLAYAILQLQKDFRKYCEQQLAPHGLTNGRYLYLIYINNHPNCSLNAVSDGLQVGKAHTTRTVAQLETLGYVARERDPADSRAFRLHLSDLGIQVLGEIKNLFSLWDGAISATIGEDVYRQLVASLNEAQKKMDRRK